MQRYPRQELDQPAPSMGAEDAWRVWHQLSQLAESIWQEHEQEFLEFCMQEAEDQCYFHRRSTDGP